MDAAGLQANFIQGMRVTDEATVDVVERVLSLEINPEIVKTIIALGGKARGFSGTEIFTCRKLWVAGADGGQIDIGFVGEVVEVNVEPLRDCIRRSITPVISSTARGTDGHIYNCNADVAAAQAAIALKAKRLVFMSDVPGLLRDPKDEESLVAHVQIAEVDGLKKSGVIDKGMIPKMDSAVAAIKSGVDKVSLVDGRVPHSVLLEIFTDAGVGTEVVLRLTIGALTADLIRPGIRDARRVIRNYEGNRSCPPPIVRNDVAAPGALPEARCAPLRAV